MLMVAQCYAMQGARVAVFTRPGELGGAWRTARIDSEAKHEIACHLIEPMPDVYSVLEAMSGCSFDVQDPQPVRLLPCNIAINHGHLLNRMIIVCGLISAALRTLLIGSLGRSNRLSAVQLKKVLSVFYWVASIATRPNLKVQAPTCGYGRFLDNLVTQCKQRGVLFFEDEISAVRIAEETCSLTGNETTYLAERVDYTASIAIESKGETVNFNSPVNRVKRGIVVSIPRNFIAKDFSYISSSGAKIFQRLAVLSSTGPQREDRVLVLIETPRKGPEQQVVDGVINELIRARFLLPSAKDILILTHFEFTTAAEQLSNVASQSKIKKITCWDSRGNLADGIHRYRSFFATCLRGQ